MPCGGDEVTATRADKTQNAHANLQTRGSALGLQAMRTVTIAELLEQNPEWRKEIEQEIRDFKWAP